jgi:hypothetical protein
VTYTRLLNQRATAKLKPHQDYTGFVREVGSDYLLLDDCSIGHILLPLEHINQLIMSPLDHVLAVHSPCRRYTTGIHTMDGSESRSMDRRGTLPRPSAAGNRENDQIRAQRPGKDFRYPSPRGRGKRGNRDFPPRKRLDTGAPHKGDHPIQELCMAWSGIA